MVCRAPPGLQPASECSAPACQVWNHLGPVPGCISDPPNNELVPGDPHARSLTATLETSISPTAFPNNVWSVMTQASTKQPFQNTSPWTGCKHYNCCSIIKAPLFTAKQQTVRPPCKRTSNGTWTEPQKLPPTDSLISCGSILHLTSSWDWLKLHDD